MNFFKAKITRLENKKMKLRFINHASFSVETDKSILICDPWVEGMLLIMDGHYLIEALPTKILLIT